MGTAVADFFSGLEDRVDPARLTGMNATFQFVIQGDGGGDWSVAVTDGKPEMSEGRRDDADVTITADAADWMDLVSGKLSGLTAMSTGRIQLKGDVSLAIKLQSLIA